MLYQDKINNLIPIAIDAIKEVFLTEGKDEEIKKAYEGYINSFGANINQCGLLPTLIFFNNNKGKEENSSLWLDAIMYVINKKSGEKNTTQKNDRLIEYVIERCKIDKKNEETDKQNEKVYKLDYENISLDRLDEEERQIKDIVIALKLALRTFKIESKDKNEKK